MTVDQVQRLVDTAEISQLKARYFRLLDQQKFDEWSELFIDEPFFVFTHPGGEHRGAAPFVEFIRKRMNGSRSVHHGGTPEIELLGSDSARGIWPMRDYVEYRVEEGTRRTHVGYGFYYDDYLKRGGAWKIAAIRLERLRVDTVVTVSGHLAFTPELPTDNEFG